MPLDKMTNVEDYQKTHESIILHIKGMPACCILDDDFFGDNKKIHHVTLRGFLNKDEKNGLLFGFTLNILIDKQNLKYVIYPNDEFIESLIFTEKIFIISKNFEIKLSFLVHTDQFVKTKYEFNKFQEMMS